MRKDLVKHRRRKWAGKWYHLCWVKSAFANQPPVMCAYVGLHTRPLLEVWAAHGEGEQEFIGRVKDMISRGLVAK